MSDPRRAGGWPGAGTRAVRVPRVAGFVIVAPALGVACSREPPPVERREPWLASASASASASAATARFEVEPGAVVRVAVPGREGRPEGAFTVARGSVEVDLADLTTARGTVEVDLTSLAMEGADMAEARLRTERARSWLDLGSSRPAAARERVRWATLTLTALAELSAATPQRGRRERGRPPLPGADGGVTVSGEPAPSAGAAPADPASAAASALPGPGPAPAASAVPSASAAPSAEAAPPGPSGSAPSAAASAPGSAPGAPAEVRSVDAIAVGQLTVHARRVEVRVPVRLYFEFPGPAGDTAPTRVIVESRGTWEVGLATHDIVPRDSLGVPITAENALLGAAVGRVARVQLWLPLEPRPAR